MDSIDFINRSIVHFCEWGVGRHNCMIPDVKKVTFFSFGARVTHYLVYVSSK